MKKTLLIAAIAGFVMASCKKEYVCECTNSNNAPNAQTTVSKTTLWDVNKSKAKLNCVSYSQDVTFGTLTYTYKSECKLK